MNIILGIMIWLYIGCLGSSNMIKKYNCNLKTCMLWVLMGPIAYILSCFVLNLKFIPDGIIIIIYAIILLYIISNI